MWPSKMGGRVARKICIDTATFITSPYRGCFHKKYQGNWFYISCSHWLSHWICYSFAIVGGSEALFLFHHTSWHRIIHTIAWWRGGGQGPLPGGALVYMALYTDQEKWSVNHIAYIVVYTQAGLLFVITKGRYLRVGSLYVITNI